MNKGELLLRLHGQMGAGPNGGVVMLTRRSVHCADKITATSSSSGVVKFSSVYTSG